MCTLECNVCDRVYKMYPRGKSVLQSVQSVHLSLKCIIECTKCTLERKVYYRVYKVYT